MEKPEIPGQQLVARRGLIRTPVGCTDNFSVCRDVTQASTYSREVKGLFLYSHRKRKMDQHVRNSCNKKDEDQKRQILYPPAPNSPGIPSSLSQSRRPRGCPAHLDEVLQDGLADGLFVCVGELSLLDQHPIPVEEIMVGPPRGKMGASGDKSYLWPREPWVGSDRAPWGQLFLAESPSWSSKITLGPSVFPQCSPTKNFSMWANYRITAGKLGGAGGERRVWKLL